jgi:SAM-dependent methyltransferase
VTDPRHGWDEIGRLDGRWAILSDPGKRGGGWETAEFFETGRLEIDEVLKRGAELGLPHAHETALDFGCGMGRLTRAMAGTFRRALGVDISPVMVREAQELNRDVPGCSFEIIGDDGLDQFQDQTFDFIYSRLVLQHIADGRKAEAAVRGLAGLVAVGGLLVFQVPEKLSFRRRLQIRPRLYTVLRGLRVAPEFLYRRIGLHPIRMHGIAEASVVQLVTDGGATIIDVMRTGTGPSSIEDRTYWVTRSL